MKHIRKKSICLLAALAIAGGCVGCSGNPPATPTGQGTTATEPTVNQYKDPSATHFYEEVREGFLVDAEVIAPAGNNPCQSYYAEPLWFDATQMEAFLKANGDTFVSGADDENAFYIMYNVECGSGSTIYYEKVHNHPGTRLIYRNREAYHYYSEYFVIPSLGVDGNPFEHVPTNYFLDKKDFSFATAEQAEQEVRQALAALGLSGELSTYLTLYIDHETMAQVGQMLATDEEYSPIGPIGESRPNNGFDLKDDWSEADDAYAFIFTVDIDGIPLAYKDWHGETASYIGCSVEVCYTASGIVYLNIRSPWDIKEPAGDPVTLVTAGAAVETVKQTLVNVLTYRDVVIEQASLEYHYIQDGTRWQLIPVWIVKSSYESWDGGRAYMDSMINAVTGQEI